MSPAPADATPATYDQVSTNPIFSISNLHLCNFPDAFRNFPRYASLHGPEQAIKILQNEKRVLEHTRAFIAARGIDSDFVDTSTFDVSMTPGSIDAQESALAAYKEAGGDMPHVQIHSGEAAQLRTHVRSALRAYEWPAASNTPA